MFTTIAPKTLKSAPTSPPPTTLDPSSVNTTHVDFERVGVEKWNVYELSDGSVLRAKLEITGILRTDNYGPDGEPLYVVNAQMIPRFKAPETLIRKQRTIKKDTRPKGLYG